MILLIPTSNCVCAFEFKKKGCRKAMKKSDVLVEKENELA